VGAVTSPTSVGLVESARTLGATRWTELRCFELVGAWAADPGPAELRVLFTTLSGHHAWRADLVRSRLPVAADLAADVVTIADPGAAALVEALRGLSVDGIARLAALARVALPRLAGTYGDMAAASAGPSDAMGRIVRVARDDAAADWHRAAGALARHLVDGDAVERAGQAVVVVDTALATTLRGRLAGSKSASP
jgi:hypothetical protein